MKNKDALRLWNGLMKLTEKKNTKFSFVVLRNKKILKDVVESLRTIQLQQVDGYDEFERDRLALCKKCAEVDEHGEAIQTTQNGRLAYVIKDKEKFNREILELFNLHKNYKKNLEEKQKQFDKLLEDDVDIKLIEINVDDLPSDLTESEISLIEEIICEK